MCISLCVVTNGRVCVHMQTCTLMSCISCFNSKQGWFAPLSALDPKIKMPLVRTVHVTLHGRHPLSRFKITNIADHHLNSTPRKPLLSQDACAQPKSFSKDVPHFG